MKAGKNGGKYGKALYNLMDSVAYGKIEKTLENLRNRIDIKLVSNKNYYL